MRGNDGRRRRRNGIGWGKYGGVVGGGGVVREL